MTCSSPSSRKHNITLQFHDERIERLRLQFEKKDPELNEMIASHQKRRAQKLQFFAEERHKDGQLWLCSGLTQRTKNNGRLDIALIDVPPTRTGSNTVPSESAWPHAIVPRSACGKPLHGLESCQDSATLNPVFKVGSATGNTSGRISAIKSDVRMEWDKRLNIKEHSTEYCFVGNGSVPFTRHGDSGSFVFEVTGSWVGAVFGGSAKNGVREPLNYVTDAQDILDWIDEKRKDAKAGKDVRGARLAMS